MATPHHTPSDSGPTGADGNARVFLRPIGTPLALGFFGIGLQSVMLAALEFEWMPPTQKTIVAITGLAFAFPAQFLATILAFLARDGVVGTALGIFSGTWAATSFGLLVSPPGATTEALGIFLILSAIALTCVVVANTGGAGKPIVSIVLGVGAARVLLTGLHQIDGGSGLEQAAAVVGLVLGAVAFYGALALLLEDERHGTVLPTLRTGGSKAAVEGGFGDQIKQVQNEAGVREQL